MNLDNRYGDWMETYTGRQFWPLDPREEEICIEDIAHSLSNQCRYAGHCSHFYSVAEHSILVSEVVPGDLALYGLLHDASEAYLVDVPRPVKPWLPEYGDMERVLQECIHAAFGLEPGIPKEVKISDIRMLIDERRKLMRPSDRKWICDGLDPYGVNIRCMTPIEAEQEFLERFEWIISQRQSIPASQTASIAA